MAKSKNQEGLSKIEGVNAFIGRSAAFEGKISTQGMLRIDGKYRGQILSDDSLVIGETAEIDGEVNVKTLSVHGTVNGDIKADRRITIHSTGKILGDIQTPILVISEGAIFEGKCQMGKEETMRDGKVPIPEVKEEARGESEVKKT